MVKARSVDWATSVVALAESSAVDTTELVRSAELDPLLDLVDIDLSGLNLAGQNLSGWNLKEAKFEGTILSNADLRGASVDPNALVAARDWDNAILDDDVRLRASALSPLMMRLTSLQLSVRTENCLRNAQIIYVGDLVQRTEAELLRTQNFGRKSLNEVKEDLAQRGLHLGMDFPDWRPPTS